MLLELASREVGSAQRMNAMPQLQEDASDKICPSCKTAAHTSLSKCPHCGTRYDAKIGVEKGSYAKVIAWTLGVMCLLAFTFYSMSTRQAEQAVERKTITSAVVVAKKPRVLEFYADWCGPCKAYGPSVDDVARRYGGRVDFQRVNIDANRELSRAFGVTAVPTTCLLNSQGQLVDKFTGGVSTDELNRKVGQLESQ